MAYLSEILYDDPGIPQECKNEASICLMCGKKIEKGGMWATQQLHTSICINCSPSLLDWYIDTLLDTQTLNEDNDIENLQKLVCDIINRYDKKKQMKVRYNKKHM